MDSRRNKKLDMARFVVAFCIILFHSHHFDGGKDYLTGFQYGVEWFFILSGLLMTKHAFGRGGVQCRNGDSMLP